MRCLVCAQRIYANTVCQRCGYHQHETGMEKAMEDPILTKIGELEANLEEFKAEYLKKQEEEAAWPKDGDDYYLVFGGGGVSETNWDNDKADNRRLKYGNVFRDKETAEKRARYLGALQPLMSLADKLNGGWKPDWGDLNAKKYYLLSATEHGSLFVDAHGLSRAPGEVLFKTEALAQEALEALTEEQKTILAEGYS